MKVKKLIADIDLDFSLVGISSHIEDYKFCWHLNNHLKLSFTRNDDLIISTKQKGVISEHSVFGYEDEHSFLKLRLVANKGSAAYLLPEQKAMDYFVIIRSPYHKADAEKLSNKIKLAPVVNTAIKVDTEKLKSKINLLELENL